MASPENVTEVVRFCDFKLNDEEAAGLAFTRGVDGCVRWAQPAAVCTNAHSDVSSAQGHIMDWRSMALATATTAFGFKVSGGGYVKST